MAMMGDGIDGYSDDDNDVDDGDIEDVGDTAENPQRRPS
jgi:hypothetical protein